MSRRDNVWADEANVELAVRLWKEGQSASQIAKRIPGVSRNAVMGKVKRMGLERLDAAPLTKFQLSGAMSSGNKPVSLRKPKPAPPPKPPKAPKAAKPFEFTKVSTMTGLRMPGNTVPHPPRAEPPKPSAFAPLPGTTPSPFGTHGVCRWPIDGYAEPMCCGQPRKDGDVAYCPAHRKRASTPAIVPIQKLARIALRFAA